MKVQPRNRVVLLVGLAVLFCGTGGALFTTLQGEPELSTSFNIRITEARLASTEATGLYSFVMVGFSFPFGGITRLRNVELVDQSGQFALVSAWVTDPPVGFNGDAADLDGTGLASSAIPVSGFRPERPEAAVLLQLFNNGAGLRSGEWAGPFTLRVHYSVLGIPMTREFRWSRPS